MVRPRQDSIQLLSAHSDSSSDSAPVCAAVKNSKTFRRPKSYRARPVINASHSFDVKERIGTIFNLVSIIILMLWIVTLTAVTIKLYRRVFEVQELTNRISAGNQGVPEEIQKCHSLSRQLQNNQTLLFSQIESITQRLYNFTMLINTVQGGLNEVESRLKGSPELVNVPSHLQSLTTSYASLGSRLEDMKTTTAHLQEAQELIKHVVQNLNENITGINTSIMSLNNTIKKGIGSTNCSVNHQESNEKLAASLLSQINPNISKVNESLSKRIDWVSEDQKKDYKMVIDLQETSANLSSQLLSLRDDVLHLSTNYTTLNWQMLNMKDNFSKIVPNEGILGLEAKESNTQPVTGKVEGGGVSLNTSSIPMAPST